MNPLDAIALNIEGLQRRKDKGRVRVWYTPDGDEVRLHYFAKAPDLPADLDSLAELRLALSRSASASGAAIIEADVTGVAGCRAVRQFVKVPQRPHGMTYLGSLTLPFRDFSFVLKIRCEERGTTGVRDTMVLNDKLESGDVRLDGIAMVGWMKDPYDATRTSGLARNLSDGDEHDWLFPDHPLSRARRFLRAAEANIGMADKITSADRFVYGTRPPSSRPWWKLW